MSNAHMKLLTTNSIFEHRRDRFPDVSQVGGTCKQRYYISCYDI